jgi:hypothetical protein
MNKKQKIQKLLTRLSKLEEKRDVKVSGGSIALNDAVEGLLNQEERKPNVISANAFKAINQELGKIKTDPRIGNITRSIKAAQAKNDSRFDKAEEQFVERLEALTNELGEVEKRGTVSARKQSEELRSALLEHIESYQEDMREFASARDLLAGEISKLQLEIPRIYEQLDGKGKEVPGMFLERDKDSATTKERLTSLEKALEELEKDITRRIATILSQRGSGNANRSIVINGNPSTLGMFTDINLKAGNNITITYSANQTSKYTDVTITGNSSGSGIVREIDAVAVDTAAGATAGTDYVYLVSGTTTITLPTAVGNENLYTVKNVGVGVVTIDTTGGQTIDGGATVSLPVQYTSVDIISNGADWAVT